MIIKELTLRNFRNHERLSLEPEKGINVITGENGTGKTNLVEAIYYLSFGRSWRVKDTQPLILSGSPSSFLKADLAIGKRHHELEILLTSKGKRISLDQKPIRRLSELSSVINVVLFTPDDVFLFKDSPSNRRSFLDTSISKQVDDYLELLLRYHRVLEERNALLKRKNPQTELLEILTEKLIAYEEPLIAYRLLYIQKINTVLDECASRLYGRARKLQLKYQPFIKVNDFKKEAKEAYQRSLETDMRHQSTTIGIHREDFKAYLDGKDIAIYGSQGENRIAAIALKMAPRYLVEDADREPIAVLDDVYGELDQTRQGTLTNLLKEFGQCFVTSHRGYSVDNAKIFALTGNRKGD